MNLSRTLRQLCKDTNTTMTELARRTGRSPQNLTKKIRTGTIRFEEFAELAEALGVRFEYSLVLPDGDSPTIPPEDGRTREKVALLEAQIEMLQRSIDYQTIVGRDCRTVLHSVDGLAEKALKHSDDPALVKDCLRKIRTASGQITELLNDPLSMFSSIGATNEEPTSFDVKPELIQGRRVLLVDDNAMNREITRDTLEDNGLEVDEADNGAFAVDMVKAADPGYYDCILMDSQMPVMDGLEATKAIRALPNRVQARIPIIAMTANAFEGDRRKSFEVGTDAYLVKPVDSSRLIQTIARFI